eukprot:2364103-Amphidinium_carterae.1
MDVAPAIPSDDLTVIAFQRHAGDMYLAPPTHKFYPRIGKRKASTLHSSRPSSSSTEVLSQRARSTPMFAGGVVPTQGPYIRNTIMRDS